MKQIQDRLKPNPVIYFIVAVELRCKLRMRRCCLVNTAFVRMKLRVVITGVHGNGSTCVASGTNDPTNLYCPTVASELLDVALPCPPEQLHDAPPLLVTSRSSDILRMAITPACLRTQPSSTRKILRYFLPLWPSTLGLLDRRNSGPPSEYQHKT
jgi:hypothetical protein